jgi:glycosyltransferase involved in cell wall biosynthesis
VKNNNDICIVTCPIENSYGSYYYLVSNFVKIIENSCNKINIITGNLQIQEFSKENITVINIKYRPSEFLIFKLLQYAMLQLKIILNLFKLRKNYSVCLILSGTLFIPTFFLSLLGKKAVLTAVASESNYIKYKSKKNFGDFIHLIIVSIMERISFKYANKIGFESPSVSYYFNVKKYTNKLFSGNMHIKSDNFSKTVSLFEREYVIGYIGRLSEEKGILNFIKAVPVIFNSLDINVNILIGGSGPLESSINEYLSEGNIDKVQIMGWIPHEELPNYLNNIKLIVFPSFTEGLPNLLLEAMACGTIVVATSVGGIPDVIKDGETGFLLENNSPECIAETALKILNMPEDKLDQVSENARTFVEENFTFEAAVERWSGIIEGI